MLLGDQRADLVLGVVALVVADATRRRRRGRRRAFRRCPCRHRCARRRCSPARHCRSEKARRPGRRPTSRSASSKTMTGALPPSSRCVRLIDFDAASSTFWPVAIEPVSESIATFGWLISALPVVCAAADDDVEHALGKDLGDERRELQRRERRHLRRLQHHRVAGHQRRADLPHRHHQRIVPRRDRADDADRVAAHHRGVARQVFRRRARRHDARGAGEEAQAVDDRRHLVVLHRVDRLAAVQRLELGEGLRRPPRCGRRASASAPTRCIGVVRDQVSKAFVGGGDRLRRPGPASPP